MSAAPNYTRANALRSETLNTNTLLVADAQYASGCENESTRCNDRHTVTEGTQHPFTLHSMDTHARSNTQLFTHRVLAS